MKTCLVISALLLAAAEAAQSLAPVECWNLRKHGQTEQAHTCFEALSRASEPYVRAEGFWGLAAWDQANEQFRLAAAQSGASTEVKVRWGMLLHERFNDADAADLFRESLAEDPDSADASLGLAIVSAQNFSGAAVSLATKSLALNPRLAAAHELMADLALTNDDRPQAREEANKALGIAQDSVGALAVLASLALLADQPPDVWLNKINAVNPRDGEPYARIAHQLQLHYRFQDAVVWYREAVSVDPQLWAAHAALGIELMRQGDSTEAYSQLQQSYDNGYRDAATVNSLRLLDSYRHFVTSRDESTVIELDESESELLGPYLRSEMRLILSTYEKKYSMKLPGPVQVEAYPNHEDFAVRTMGMPGLGALGVTFGRVIAMDSPSARKPGDFNWGATLWHEMSHVFVLTATNYRVPRWFTEGLAVHEEGAHSTEWTNQPTPDVLAAIRDKKLLPITRLDRGFVFPDYPAQVIVSYFQAGTICDFIQSTWGDARLLAMIKAYAGLKSTAQVVQETLGLTPEEFDRRYLVWIEKRYGAEAANFGQWRIRLKDLLSAEQAKRLDAVLQQGPGVIDMYPEYVGDANAYEVTAQAAKENGDSRLEAATLLSYRNHGGQSPALLKRLASLQESSGDAKEAAATLQRINYVYPVKDEELHRHLGDLLLAQHRYDEAVQEYGALVAIHPADKAGAEFSLAQAYFAAGRRDKAQESVLAALEVAPGYRPAQKLLLQLEQGQAPKNN